MTLPESLRNIAKYMEARGCAIEISTKAPLWKDLCKAADEIERLQAIVDRLPKTKDGVQVVPRLDDVWHPDELYQDELVSGVVDDEDEAEFDRTGNGAWYYHPICECYSTHEAATRQEANSDDTGKDAG